MTEVVISLTIRDLTPEDLPWCSWSASVTGIARALDRAGRGEADYSGADGLLAAAAVSEDEGRWPVLLADAVGADG